jgi:6-phosphogluconolactonase (cycloisomerase 2 family)
VELSFGVMKTYVLTFLVSFITSLTLTAQVIRPVFTIKDEPGPTNNTHITSDGKFYYTCNGGTDKDGNPRGKINKYILSGEFVKSYSFKPFSMRSIMYNSKDKHLYIATFDRKIYKIIDLESGTTELLFKQEIYKNPQSAIALDPDGKTLYVLDGGTLTMYKFKDGSIIKTISGLSYGADDKDAQVQGKFGSTAVAVDNKFIYTWDSHPNSKKIYAYDKKGSLVKVFLINNGNWGYTLSYTNGYVFTALNGPGRIGLWYGYHLWAK